LARATALSADYLRWHEQKTAGRRDDPIAPEMRSRYG
jgi:hypothetical protein